MPDRNPGSRPTSVFVYEHVCGGGMADIDLPESWAAEGRQMLEAAVTAFADAGCKVITTLDRRFDLPLPAEIIVIESPEQLEIVLAEAIARTHYGLLIAPETDGILHRLISATKAAPGWNLGSLADAVAICGDKLATARHFLATDQPHPPTWPAESWSMPNAPDARFVVKPLDGAGTLETFLAASHSVAEILHSQEIDRTKFLVQTHVPGISAGLSFLVDDLGNAQHAATCIHDVRLEPAGSFISRFVLESGEPAASVHPETVAQAASAVRSIPGVRGWVGVDVILDPGGKLAAILEINPRLTSSFVWSLNRIDRSNIVHRWLAEAAPRPL